MIPVLKLWLMEAPWLELMQLLADVALKGTVLCVAAGIASVALRRSPASTRSLLWVFVLVGLVILPVFSLVTPLWHFPLVPELNSWGASSYNPDYVKPDQVGLIKQAQGGEPGASSAGAGFFESLTSPVSWPAWGVLLWVLGGVAYLCWHFLSHTGVRKIVGRAYPAEQEWSCLIDSAARELVLRRNIRLLESQHIKAAITVGILKPAIVLPSDSREWSEDRRRLVLSHELAHVKRRDTLIELLALVVTVMYWFNPLVWLAVKQLRIERERDCDDAVLYAGAKPSDYAELLIKIASELAGSARPVWQLTTISQNSNLKDRLMSILNQKTNRSRGTRRSAVLTGLLVLALALPISTSGIWNAQAGEKSKKVDKAKTEEMKKKEMIKKKQMSAQEQVKLRMEKICAQENSAACKVGKIIKTKGPEAGIKAFYKMKAAEDGQYVFKEAQFNALGYAFLYNGAIKEAVAVFELNVKEYPESWNVYDSLGEAHMVAKRYDEAEKYYKKALALNPDSESSQHALQKLQTMYSETF